MLRFKKACVLGPVCLLLLCSTALAWGNPPTSSSYDFHFAWTEDFSWGAWDDGTGNLDYTSSDLYQGANSQPHRIFLLHADESTGGACNMGMLHAGVFVLDDEQVAGNWTDPWGDSARTTCVRHVYDDPTGRGAEGVLQIGQDYFDFGRGGLEDMSPMRVESDIYDPDYDLQQNTVGYTDLDHVITAPLDNGNSYIMTREAVNINGDIYAVAYKSGPNPVGYEGMVTDKANLIKLTYTETSGGWTMDAHADMSNSSSPWSGGIDLSDTAIYTDSVTGDGISKITGMSVWNDKIYLAGQKHGTTDASTGGNGDDADFYVEEGAPILELDPVSGAITELGRFGAAALATTNGAEEDLSVHQVCRYGNEIFLVNNTRPTSCAYWAEIDSATGLIDDTTWQGAVIADYVGGAEAYDDQTLEGHGIAVTGNGTEATGFWVTATGKVDEVFSPSIVFFEKDAEEPPFFPEPLKPIQYFAYLASNWQYGTENWGGGDPLLYPNYPNEIGGDINRDGVVDARDFAWLMSVWQYGTEPWPPLPSEDPIGVPEPGSIGLVLAGLLGLLAVRFRKRGRV